ncbi:cupredoxin domain-containing protein [Arthrobacter sp. PAMC25284]|uniref:cupredoxin domain-containing protein n=1 Tax=Arthrobacter sp. PAMC25284 TaxID=2861279 RepID=UPI001C632276|nr:cupredoxin domain-containing protein [Arthrobacter sp. PAMC25284]QYF91052.1 cupredoxin domain-containing protein [Arthrobacter sp. PAMC25284]
MNIGHRVWIIAAAAGLAGLTGCSSPGGDAASQGPTPSSASSTQAPSAAATPGSTSEPSKAPAAAGETKITIKDFAYEMPASVAPGATITVTNEDTAPHTVTAKDGGAFNAQVAAGETATFTAPEEPGEYAIICTFHPRMSGTLIVK